LIAYFNSNSWKYKPNDRDTAWYPDEEHLQEDLTSLVDLDSMYYSPMGFGWNLHMGRLFRLFKSSLECDSYEYVYEDPSGATHLFGPDCNQPNGDFWSVDGSNMLLQVTGYPNDPTVILFDASGRKYYFSEPVRTPNLPVTCDGEFKVPFTFDRVMNVTKITDFSGSSEINIEYCDKPMDTGDYRHHYYEHAISKIIDPFGRILAFQHGHLEIETWNGNQRTINRLPYYTHIQKQIGFNQAIQEPVFTTFEDSYKFHMKTVGEEEYVFCTVDEPTRLAHAKLPDEDGEPRPENMDDYIIGNVSIPYQLLLEKIKLPAEFHTYEYSFEYGSSGEENRGELKSYTTPLGAEVEYTFRNVETEQNGIKAFENGTKDYLRKNVSRFLCRKKILADTNYVWKYGARMDAYTGTSSTDYVYYSIDYIEDNEDITPLTRDHFGFGNTIGLTSVVDPGGNEIRYLWVNNKYTCYGADKDPRTYKYDGSLNCPDQTNAYNGQLAKIYYFDGAALNNGASYAEALRKEEIFNNAFPINPDDYREYGAEYHGLPCQDNPKTFRRNIRTLNKKTKIYRSQSPATPEYPNNYTGDTDGDPDIDTPTDYILSEEETFYHEDPATAVDFFGVVTAKVVHRTGLTVFGTAYEYAHTNDDYSVQFLNVSATPESTRYKVDFVTKESVYSGSELIKQTEFEPYFRGGETTGRVESKKLKNGQETVVVEYEYENTHEQLKTETWIDALNESGEDLVYHYSFEWGYNDKKYIGDEDYYLVDNEYDYYRGWKSSSKDTVGNVTTYQYDNINRIYEINPPGDDSLRLVTRIDYNQNNGRDVRYYKELADETQIEFKRYRLDKLGNLEKTFENIYRPTGYSSIITQESVYDWKGREIAGMNPGQVDAGYGNEYDCLDRIKRVIRCEYIDDEEGWNTSESQITFDLITDPADTRYGMSLKRVTDDIGITRNYYTDLDGNLREVYVPDADSTAGDAVYDYDALGNLISVNPGDDSERTFIYDMLGRLRESYEPETGQKYYCYFGDGKLHKEGPNSEFTFPGTKIYTYEKNNRLSLVEQLVDSCGMIERVPLTELFYDNEDPPLKNGVGRLTSRIDYTYSGGIEIGKVTSVYSYNKYGDVTDEWCVIEGPDFVSDAFHTVYTFNNWGMLESTQYPKSKLIVEYENEDRINPDGFPGSYVTQISMREYTNSSIPRNVAQSVFYSFTGNIEQIQYDNGAIFALVPDKRNRYKYIGAMTGTGAFLYFDQYNYNQVNQITEINNIRNLALSAKKYSYYSDGSLKSVKDHNEQELVSYTYDSRGNMTARQIPDASPDTLVYSGLQFNEKNQLQSDINGGYFTYDDNGNVSYNPITECSYHFDNNNRLINVSGPVSRQYIYDGSNNRRLQITDDEYQISFYDRTGNNLIEKIKYERNDEGQYNLVKNECFINLGRNNLAQIDFFEPLVSIDLNGGPNEPDKTVFGPYDHCEANVSYSYLGEPIEAEMYNLVECDDTFWYLPASPCVRIVVAYCNSLGAGEV